MEEVDLIEAILDYFDEASLFDDMQFGTSLLDLIILLLLEILENYYPKLFSFLQKNERLRNEFGRKLLEQAKKIEDEISESDGSILKRIRDENCDEEDVEKTKSEIYGKAAWMFSEYLRKASEYDELEMELGISFGSENGDWQEQDISTIIEMAKSVKSETSIRKFAAMIGRHSKANDSLKYEEHDAYRGRVGELRLSDDVGAAVPSELALLRNPLTKKLFMAKFAQKQILSFTYKNMIPVPVSKGKGPVIICLDTSGSMQGNPEKIAKMLTYAISTIAFKEKRNVYVISFSCGIETCEFLWNKKSDAISRLARFLRGSFYGGTDVEPALEHSINLMKSSEWENADVLIISDFCVGDMSSKMITEMRAIRENGTRFFSLLIGSGGNSKAIECFDENSACDEVTRNIKIKKMK